MLTSNSIDVWHCIYLYLKSEALNLIIDQGNTLTKYALFDNGSIITHLTHRDIDEETLLQLTNSQPITKAILSSVRSSGVDDFDILRKIVPSSHYFNERTKLPFINEYNTPQTQGKDRLAAVAGGITLWPGANMLVIDAGTAITFELIENGQYYKGGNISPGMALRFKSLNEFTSQLPLCSPDAAVNLIGQTTNTAIIAGVQNSIAFEIDGYISELSQRYDSLKVAITGGDAEFFAGKLKNTIFVHQNLVLIGLNRILEYNA